MGDSLTNCSIGGNVCVICMRLFNQRKVTFLQAELQFLTLVFGACSKFLVSDVFKKCFEWNFIEKKSSPVCTDCFSHFEKLFRFSMQITQIRSEIQLETDSFTNQIQSRHKELDLICAEKDPLDIRDLITENDAANANAAGVTSIHHPDLLMNPICDIEIIDLNDIKSEDDENTVVPSTQGVALIDPLSEDNLLLVRETTDIAHNQRGTTNSICNTIEKTAVVTEITITKPNKSSSSCENIADETNLTNTIPLKSLKIILKRLEFDSEGKIKSTPPSTDTQTSTKRKAAVAAAKCLKKIVQFEQKGHSKPTSESDYSDESSIHNSDSNYDSDSNQSADFNEDDALQVEDTITQKPNSTFKLRTLIIEKVKYFIQKKYQCQSCKLKFNFIRDLNSHSLSSGHSNVRRFSCNSCTKSFYKLNDLKTHQRRCLCQFKFKCKKCPKEFDKQWKLQSHNRSHTNHRFECKNCKKAFFHKRIFLQHRRSHSKNSHTCQKCKINFPWKILLDQHNRIHDAREKYICKICRTKYRTRFSLNLHHHLVHAKNVSRKYLNNAKLMIHKIKSYRCSICHERFKSDTQLRLHKDATGHPTMRKFRCFQCTLLFYRMIDLNFHKEKHNMSNEKLYDCQLCQAKYKRQQSLLNHQLEKHDRKNFKCEVCDATIKTLRNFKIHRLTHSISTFDCEICRAKFRSELTLQNHKASAHPEQLLNFCQHCRKQFETKDLYSNHFCDSYNDLLYKCDLCNENCNSESDLNSHSKKCPNSNSLEDNGAKSVEKNESGTKKGQHECKYCDKTFNLEDSLRLHTKSHNNDISRLSCKICGQVFTNRGSVDKHLKSHSSKIHFKCKFCDKIFSGKSGLEYHMDFNHATKDFECHICKRSCGSKKSLDKHIKLHSRKRINKNLICEECGKCFKKMYALKRHKLTHGSYKFNCGLCAFNCSSKNRFQLHVMTIHNKEFKFQCTMCGKNHKTSVQLENHMKNHTGEKPYECSICLKKFKTKLQLSDHGNYHAGIKFKCPICDKEFASKASLNIHSKTHGESSFQCDHCGKKCKRKHNLITHMRSHTGEKPFQCEECGQGFTRLDNLNTHLKLHHRLRSRNKKSEELNENDVDNSPSEESSDEDN